ncbi:transcriptional regulator [Citrobacter freundii]|uniref:helix-turn-helix domain-containing protein n=1 Tax=Citrobacter freundii TaxID=546 RepID=UPI00242C02D7|nr:helix-turn-helix domain-containing protein [Citrobacter freundii]WFW93798.1 transcriptional regulator [Citrobacter freundii]
MMGKQAWRIFKTHEEYEQGMARLLQLAESDLVEGSPDFEEFELLSLLIGHYEDKKFPMDKPDPIEAIKFRMDQQGLTQADMKQYIGSASKVSEVLNYKRPLSLSMIKRLHSGLGIPADILIQDTKNVEWSPLAYSAENFAVAFGDACKKLIPQPQYTDKTNNYEEVATIFTRFQFKTDIYQMGDNLSKSVKIGESFISNDDVLSLDEFQRA